MVRPTLEEDFTASCLALCTYRRASHDLRQTRRTIEETTHEQAEKRRHGGCPCAPLGAAAPAEAAHHRMNHGMMMRHHGVMMRHHGMMMHHRMHHRMMHRMRRMMRHGM